MVYVWIEGIKSMKEWYREGNEIERRMTHLILNWN